MFSQYVCKENIYIYIYIERERESVCVCVYHQWSGTPGSIPGCVIQKTQKMVFDHLPKLFVNWFSAATKRFIHNFYSYLTLKIY